MILTRTSCRTCNEIIKKRRNIVDNDIVFRWHCGRCIEIGKGYVLCEKI